MRGVNKVILIGNVGKDPDLQYVEGNIPVAKFPMATTEMYKDKNGNQVSQTEWHTIVVWRALAELAQKFVHKGSIIYVEGRIRSRHWEDKDKVRRSSTEIVADNLVMLDKRKDDNGEHHPDPTTKPADKLNYESGLSSPETGKDVPPL